jgi:hypothetical protein
MSFGLLLEVKLDGVLAPNVMNEGEVAFPELKLELVSRGAVPLV